MTPPAPPEAHGTPARPPTGRAAAAWGLGVLLALAALWAGLYGLFSAVQQEGPPDPDAVHITRAQVQAQEGRGVTSPPADPASAVPTGPWRTVALPHAPPTDPLRTVALPPGAVPVTDTWYRLTVPGADRIPAPRHLYLARWKAEGRIAVYADGRLLYQSQADLPWNGSNRPLWIALDNTADTTAPHDILVRIQHLRGTQAALSTAWLGSDAALTWRYQSRDWLQAQLPFMGSAAFLAVGVFALGIGLRQRHDRIYALFFAMSAAVFVHSLQYHLDPAHPQILSGPWLGWFAVNALAWLVLATHLFLEQLHRRRMPWLTRTMVLATAALGALTLPWWSAHGPVASAAPAASALGLALLVLGHGVFAAGLWNAWRSSVRDAALLAGWGLASMQFGVFDWLLQHNRVDIEATLLGAYADVGAFFLFTYVMFRRYVGAIREAEQLTAGLAARLQAREAELEESHRRLHETEQRQVLVGERQRLMRDMHDGVGSSLATVIHSVQHSGLDRQQLGGLLQDCMDGLKLAIDSMEPVETDLLLLLATLRFRLAPRIESAGIRLHWQVQDLPALAWLEPASALHILRILQEAFANVLRHAGARTIRVETAATGDAGVLVAIEDDGRGFAPPAEGAVPTPGTGRGLHNQRHRAAVLHGRVSWTSGPAGTRFELWLPRDRPAGA